ncbi:HlyD family type I secretion periplasmic adaptor subunit [Sulfurimonas sp. HSL-3221]|uniref:HlyD family type I secretion periplasmic adaptor subunit n=1 Tax=Thiomicrolovo sulfuroxydans TaxID=2894755 RepID=UPI001E54DEA6|nr:HlyD family type I secretion periplasmic adaptor subunit [Sulfurimonas sp. HSL-3221]UFS61454.1 HlyD family type I secretion periplasmic adaptor subunit [Sulfurimonas sp. HSL-3221]
MLDSSMLSSRPPKRPSDKSDLRPRVVSEEELAYLNSRSAAVLERTALHSRLFLWIMLLTVAVFIVWADHAMIDEVVKGNGKIVPSSQIKPIQNLEGGIVKEILIKEGDLVKKGEPLLKMQDIYFSSTVEKTRLEYDELYARAVRLRAEAHGTAFLEPETSDPAQKVLIEKERSLFTSNRKQLKKSIAVLDAQIVQRSSELKEAREHYVELEREMELVRKEIEINKPLVEKRIVPEVDYIKLQRDANNVQQSLTTTRHQITSTRAMIDEAKSKRDEAELAFQNRAKEELNGIEAQMQRIKESQAALEDQVSRTLVRSPVDGIVKRLYVTTIGGVVTPGMKMMDILPTGDSLLVEVKVHPRDIAFLYPDQRAVIKITAYDFAIYGGLSGRVVRISPDSINEADGKTYYQVWIETDKTFLGTVENPLKLIPGMVVNAEIITGKKSILDYILQPLLRTKDNAFKER